MTFRQDTLRLLSSADGEPVALHDFGGNGPSLLLTHGNGLNSGMWAAALPHLTERFHCFGVDLRGHGAAREVSDGHDVSRERFGEDVLACVDTIGAPTRLAGHSLGGAAAIHAALIRPQAFAGLWLYEPVLIPLGFDRSSVQGPSKLVELSRRRRMEFDSIDDAVDRFSSKPPFFGCDSFAVRGYLEIGSYPVEGGIRLACTGENEARVFDSGSEFDFGRLAAIEVPVVIASGGNADEANDLPPKMAPQIAEALGNAVWEEHQWLSHFGPMEAPRTIANSIIEHLG
jgi:pimeloyl-ACP methyl ester carboxylesterase